VEVVLAEEPQVNEAFLREVDEELRRSELEAFGRKWGRWLIAGIGGGLALFGFYLWWQSHQLEQAGLEGEKFAQVSQDLAAAKNDEASKGLDALATSSSDGYRASAKLTKAAMALEKNDVKGAVAHYAAVVADSKLSQPWRDLALIRQTHAELDTLKPNAVIARLKPLAAEGNPWFGSAGEMVAISYLKLGKPELAGKVFADMAKDEAIPESIRARAVQMAGQLGVQAAMTAGKEPGK
jgi:hypothetical protein